jgi:hypothetical protein
MSHLNQLNIYKNYPVMSILISHPLYILISKGPLEEAKNRTFKIYFLIRLCMLYEQLVSTFLN